MNSLLNSEHDSDVEDMDRRSGNGKDREITLGTTVILGIFFALAVYGAVFFGFGYSMGAKHVATTGVFATEANSSGPFNSFKPAPGSPAASSAKPAAGSAVAVPLTTVSGSVASGSSGTPFVPKAPASTSTLSDVFTSTDPPSALPSATGSTRSVSKMPPASTSSTAPTAVPTSAGQTMVQVAAVSHQEDADLLVSTLARHGYNVAIHSEPQDRLLHVQIGPFVNRKDADVIRQKLLSDGFNAILK